MGRFKALLAGTALGIATLPGHGFVAPEIDKIVSTALPPLDELPPEVPQALEGLVCAETCAREQAIGRLSTKHQVLVRLKDITKDGEDLPFIAHAVVAKEDRRFWEHDGLDPQGAARTADVRYLSGWVYPRQEAPCKVLRAVMPLNWLMHFSHLYPSPASLVT